MKKEDTIENVILVEIDKLKPNLLNPRDKEDYSEDMLKELMENIKLKGKIENAIIINKQYIIAAGHRRYYAAKYLGFTHIPCIMRDLKNTRELFDLQVSENLKRKDPNPFEKGKIYQYLLDNHIFTLSELRKRDKEVSVCINFYLNTQRTKKTVDSIKYNSVMSEFQRKKNYLQVAKKLFGKKESNILEDDKITIIEVMDEKEATTIQVAKVADILENQSNKSKSHSKKEIQKLFDDAMQFIEIEFLIYSKDREMLARKWREFNNTRKNKEDKLSIKQFQAEILNLLLNDTDNLRKISNFMRKGVKNETTKGK